MMNLQPLHRPTVRGVLAKALGAEQADAAIAALTLHLTHHYSGAMRPASCCAAVTSNSSS
jgi:hypothetical protein